MPAKNKSYRQEAGKKCIRHVAFSHACKHAVNDRIADANGSRSLRSRQNDGHYVIDSNRNHNHEMKEIFKSAATRARGGRGPVHDFYAGLLAKGMKPEV